MRRVEDPDPALLKEKDVREDPGLTTFEKEFRILGPKDRDRLVISSEIAPAIRYTIAHSESDVEWVRIIAEDIVAVKATIPRSLVLLKSEPRNSNHWSQVFSKQEGSDD
jgi:hypothetical protein